MFSYFHFKKASTNIISGLENFKVKNSMNIFKVLKDFWWRNIFINYTFANYVCLKYTNFPTNELYQHYLGLFVWLIFFIFVDNCVLFNSSLKLLKNISIQILRILAKNIDHKTCKFKCAIDQSNLFYQNNNKRSIL